MVEKTQKLLADTEAKNEKLRKTSTVKTKKLQDNRHCLTESEGKIKTLKNENLKLKNKQKQLFQYYESTTIKLLNQNQRVKELEAKVANFGKFFRLNLQLTVEFRETDRRQKQESKKDSKTIAGRRK